MKPEPLPPRLESLDALRGFDMFWIVGGSWIVQGLHDLFANPATAWIQTQMTHVEWEGFRFWDIIMPLFLFIVGAAIPFSFHKRLSRGDSKGRILGHVGRRFLVLFVLGMAAQGHLLEYDLAQLHLFSNTLQAIAVGYAVTALALLFMSVRGQILLTAGLLIVFWLLMLWVPVPGYGAGDLSPEGNLAMHIDRLILGPFQDGTDYTWILSGLGFGATVLLGALAGQLLRSPLSPARKAGWLALFGLGCWAGGWLWGWIFPVIKHLWTSSFVLYSGGLCLLLLSGFYWIMDVRGWKRWAFPFKVIGMNAIVVYMATRLFDFRLIGDILVAGTAKWIGNGFPLIRGSAGFAVIWFLLYFLYRRRIFIKI